MTTSADALRAKLADIRLAYANLETPYRGLVEVPTFERTPGPRAPLSASVIDQRETTRRTLAAIVAEHAPHIDHAPPARTVEGYLTWLTQHAERVAPAMHPGDLFDLEVLREQLVRMSGVHTDDTDAAVALAEARRAAMPGASHYGSAREISRLATDAGRPVSRGTVQRWAAAGDVDTREIAGQVTYSLDDVLIHHDLQTAPQDEPERPQYGEGHRASSRAVADLATEAGWQVNHMSVQRWARAGLVSQTQEGYAYDDVMDLLIGGSEEVSPAAA